MAQLLERNQIGKIESYEELIAVVDQGECPMTTMIPKGKKNTQALHNWQVKDYKEAGLKGIPDGVDVTDVDHNTREVLQMYWQKFRYAYGVSDLAGEASVHGSKSELAEQRVDAAITFKRMIEKRIASDFDVRTTDDGTRGTEFRGAFEWLSADAQAALPVPEDFRPQAEYTGTLAAFDFDQFKTSMATCYKERKGKAALKAFVGIDMKEAIDDFLVYRDTVAGKDTVQMLQAGKKRVIEDVVDRLVTSTGEVMVYPHSFLRSDIDGNEQAGTHLSGLFLDLRMWRLNWNRAPRNQRLENRGGGEKEFYDAICTLLCLNPLGQLAAKIDSAS